VSVVVCCMRESPGGGRLEIGRDLSSGDVCLAEVVGCFQTAKYGKELCGSRGWGPSPTEGGRADTYSGRCPRHAMDGGNATLISIRSLPRFRQVRYLQACKGLNISSADK